MAKPQEDGKQFIYKALSFAVRLVAVAWVGKILTADEVEGKIGLQGLWFKTRKHPDQSRGGVPATETSRRLSESSTWLLGTESDSLTPNALATADAGRRDTLFIGNLPYEVSQHDLIAFLEQQSCRYIAHVHLPLDRTTLRNQGIAFVMFADQPSAEDALASLNGAALQGRPCSVEWARHQKKS